ncbi:alpha/beta fold hydrolase [Virgibacillus senegalensis]|uniref:alpha/beta fold hydrolase n=1 Tax=Virgibacillus senegalensis TaxID=1499679 RepID=UPI00069E27FF|nr:alpha/beta fold hydrolase [Virgibacillus senegalensis]
MIDRLKKHRYLLFFVVAVLVVIGGSLTYLFSKPIRSQDNTDIVPTVFVHGFKGTYRSFDTLLNRLEAGMPDTRRLVFRVNAEGDLSIRGRYFSQAHPFVQVVFENNQASIADQTVWLQKVMSTLRETYGFEQANLVGHSMGGLTSANFLLTSDGEHYPTVNKLIVIGSPFKGISAERYYKPDSSAAAVDLRVDSPALTSMVTHKAAFPAHTQVLAIAGALQRNDNPGDGLVAVSSALGIKDIVQKDHYHQEVFFDREATHSGLHEHLGVDKAITSFLWPDL